MRKLCARVAAALGILAVVTLRIARWAWPGWWLYSWYIKRFIRHDCDENSLICRTEWVMYVGPIGRWLDV